MNTNILKIGSIVTCQFGNSFDKAGYTKSTDVIVLGHKILDHMPNDPLYLVKEVGENRVGRASLANSRAEGDEDIVADLYCTAKAVWNNFGTTPFRTMEDAVKALF